MNCNTIKNIFNNKFEEILNKELVIKSTKGEETYIASKEEHFEQIYVSAKNKKVKYSKIRSKFPKEYFIGDNGTLLKLRANGDIRLVENVDKDSNRRACFITLNSDKKPTKFRNYQLIAFVFESNSTEKADYLLEKYGVKAIKHGVIVHHKKGLDYNSPNCLQILTEEEHKLLTKALPSSSGDTVTYLECASKVLSENSKPTITLTEHLFDRQGNKLSSKENRFSEIKSISNPRDIEALESEINGILENSYFPLSIVSYQNEICTLFINKKSNDGILLDKKNNIVGRHSLKDLKFFGLI